MNENRYAIIVPAFISSYPGGERELFEEMDIRLHPWIKKVSDHTQYSLERIEKSLQFVSEEPLLQQLTAYLYSCALGSYIKERKGPPAYIAGYSMGIYAAMFLSGILSFEAGICWIVDAYNKMKETVRGKHFALAAVVGLNMDDVARLINDLNGNLEIINQNNAYSFVVAGQQNQINNFINSAKEFGALSVSGIPSGIPYHTSKLTKPAKVLADNFDLNLNKPDSAIKFVSTIDQEIVDSREKAKHELVRNLVTPLNWHQTMHYMLTNSIHTFLECGVGKDLTKMGRFIEGDFKIVPVYKLKKWLRKSPE